MRLFSTRAEISPVPTELTERWFHDWANGIRGRMAMPHEIDWFLDKAVGVIDHDCSDYVERYCDRRAMAAYSRYVQSSPVTPWNLVALVAGCNPKPEWPSFIVDDMKAKLGRFGDIVVDPSIAT